MVAAYEPIIAGFTLPERTAMLHANASKLYRLD